MSAAQTEIKADLNDKLEGFAEDFRAPFESQTTNAAGKKKKKAKKSKQPQEVDLDMDADDATA